MKEKTHITISIGAEKACHHVQCTFIRTVRKLGVERDDLDLIETIYGKTHNQQQTYLEQDSALTTSMQYSTGISTQRN
jgi:hypothetical protein